MKEKLDPRQINFLLYYNDPKSETYANALQSALKAGYKQEYAESITAKMPDWLAESSGRRKRMLVKAEDRLEMAIDSEDERVATDVSKFIAKTVGKEHYSERTEMTGKDGKDLIVNISKEVAEKNNINDSAPHTG